MKSKIADLSLTGQKLRHLLKKYQGFSTKELQNHQLAHTTKVRCMASTSLMSKNVQNPGCESSGKLFRPCHRQEVFLGKNRPRR